VIRKPKKKTFFSGLQIFQLFFLDFFWIFCRKKLDSSKLLNFLRRYPQHKSVNGMLIRSLGKEKFKKNLEFEGAFCILIFFDPPEILLRTKQIKSTFFLKSISGNILFR